MIKKIANIHIIINPSAGRNESILPVINTVMQEAGIKWEVFVTHQAGDAIRFAEASVKQGIDALAVYGGDGTLMEAISGLMGSEIPLAILPGGSANFLATELGIPNDLKKACMLLSHGPLQTKTIDVGQFDKQYFIVGISLGIAADVVKGADRETKSKYGIFAYLFTTAAALKKAKTAEYHLNIDGQEHKIQGMTCFIANTGYLWYGKVPFKKHIDVSDGLLDVIVVRKANLNLLKSLVVNTIKRKRQDRFELVEHWQGKEISVSSSHKQTVQCDGEVLGKIPLHIKIIPAAIKVLVPPQ